MRGFGLRRSAFDGGGGVEDEAVEGEGVDDEELADVFGVGLGEHECEKAAHGVADDGDLLEVVDDDVLVELLDYRGEDGAGGIGAGGLSGEACQLDEVKAVGGGEESGLGGVDVSGAGEAGDEEDVGAFAGGYAFDDDREARGCGGDGLAEERLSQQQDAGKEEEKDDDAKSGAGCSHQEAPWAVHWNYLSVRCGLRYGQCSASWKWGDRCHGAGGCNGK